MRYCGNICRIRPVKSRILFVANIFDEVKHLSSCIMLYKGTVWRDIKHLSNSCIMLYKGTVWRNHTFYSSIPTECRHTQCRDPILWTTMPTTRINPRWPTGPKPRSNQVLELLLLNSSWIFIHWLVFSSFIHTVVFCNNYPVYHNLHWKWVY